MYDTFVNFRLTMTDLEGMRMIFWQGSSNKDTAKLKVVCRIEWMASLRVIICGVWGMLVMSKVCFNVDQRFEGSDRPRRCIVGRL
jgi:hypothetical protein